MMSALDNSVATTIFQQLGGRRFIVMTGARHFVGSETALRFRLPRSQDGANMVVITLTPLDEYTVETFSVRGLKVTPKSSREGVYCDVLQAVFTELTGLETSLGTMGRM